MTPYEAIIAKRDLRMYTDQPIPDDVLHRILQAGRMAGSAKNFESNRLVVVTDQAVQDALADAGDFSSWIGSSAMLIGLATPVGQERPFDVGRQAQNMMLAATSLGLASCPIGFARFVTATKLYPTLKVAGSREVKLALAIGYGDEVPKEHERVKDNVFHLA